MIDPEMIEQIWALVQRAEDEGADLEDASISPAELLAILDPPPAPCD